MAFLQSWSELPSDLLILGEVAVTALVVLGVRSIRRNQVARHRLLMLSALALNLALLAGFLVVDLIRASNTLQRGLPIPALLFWTILGVHLAIAVTALVVAVRAWLIARPGVVRDGQGTVVNLTPPVRAAHRRVSTYYPGLWYATFGTGLVLYLVLYLA